VNLQEKYDKAIAALAGIAQTALDEECLEHQRTECDTCGEDEIRELSIDGAFDDLHDNVSAARNVLAELTGRHP